jgi:hypothetical protein
MLQIMRPADEGAQGKMKIAKWFKRKITGRHEALSRERAERLRHMPKDQARRELGSILYELCVKHASEFVKDELQRGDSPFKGASSAALFHEMLAVTFWIVDREIGRGKKDLAADLHEHYFRSFSAHGTSPEERNRALLEKYQQYEFEWDDVSGHQDEFGLLVAQNIFGPETSDRTRERTFWIINYTHDVMDDITLLKKECRQAGFGSSPDTDPNR